VKQLSSVSKEAGKRKMSKQEAASFDKNKIVQDEVSATGKVMKQNMFIL
jgi:hypothetical protein